MRTTIQVLSADERAQVHERTLHLLAKTGVRVDTGQGRRFLQEAGAEVDEHTHVVRFPRALVEESLRMAPKAFSLGARRPGWDLVMNQGDTKLLIDGEAMFILDVETGERRLSTFEDWLMATQLVDALDEIGAYWPMVEGCKGDESVGDYINYWRHLFRYFSKHIQDTLTSSVQAPWLLEVLQVVFGDKQTIRRRHPLSFLLCPQSPLIIGEHFTEAYLALLGWDIPVAIMPMPLMGATAPGSLMATILIGNCEILALLCLLQSAAPGTPVIYAPVLATMDPRTGRYSGGAIEQGVLNIAGVEMAHYYGLPAEASGIGTDHHVPSIQAGYERALNGLLPVLARPDILVGPGLLGGSMILSFEQLLIDVEVFKMFRQAQRGVVSDEDKWLTDVIGQVGHGGNFLGEPSTRAGIRDGEWHISELGVHDAFETWVAAGKPSLLEKAQEKVTQILAAHQPLPLDEGAERELDRIEERARREVAST